jgi:hypothetical protein
LSIKKIRKMRYFLKVAYEVKFICKIAGLVRGCVFIWLLCGDTIMR